MTAKSLRRGLVFGCGGTLGAAWTTGALSAVRDVLDWDPREAEVLVGTSAGAEMAAALGAGLSVDDLLAAQQDKPDAPAPLRAFVDSAPGMLPPRPSARIGSLRLAAAGLRRQVAPMTALCGLLPVGRGDATRLSDLARGLAGGRRWVPHPRTWLVAADHDTGERVAFGAPGAPEVHLDEALRASWAVPGWYPPVAVGGRRYIDGGVVSPTSADLVAPLGLDEVLVLAPMTSADPGPARGLSRVERLVRSAMTATLDREIAALRASGVRVLRLDPGARDLAVMGANFMDRSRRLDTVQTSLETSRATLIRSLRGE